MISITPRIAIAESEIQEEFVRSSGPGGQNVNKVSSAVQLRFDIPASSLPPDVKARLTEQAGKRVTSEGVLLIKGQQFRTQEKNRADAQERLVELIRAAAVPPVVRHATRPTRGSRLRTQAAKTHRSALKASRKLKPGEE